MKRFFVLGIVLAGTACSVFAQGFYFDIGLGVGQAWTKMNGDDIVEGFKSAGIKIDETGIDFGLKAGYGPLGNTPVYIVGEFGGIGHRIKDRKNYLQFNSYIIGPGVIFYPIPLVQLGAGIGYSYVANQTDIPGYTPYNSQGGFAWNISAAFDVGSGKHGCLLGLKYFNAANKLETSDADENASAVTLFVRYTYRHKTSSGSRS